MKILILGGTGFIGSHLIDGFLSVGHEVRVFSHDHEKFRDPNPQVEYFINDFGEQDQLDKALSGVDMVFHLVWSTVPSTSNEQIIMGLNENVINTVKLIELMEKNQVRKIVFFSSGGAVYGNAKEVIVKEDTGLFPISAYGISKLTIEKYINLFQYLNKIDGIILRPSNPYGPHQNFNGVQGVISRFLYLIHQGEPITVLGDGSVIRDYIYIDDLVDLCLKVSRDFKPGIYNASAKVGYNLLDLIEVIKKVTGKEIIVNFAEGRPFDVKRVVLDHDKAKNTFNWTPETSIEAGVKAHWEWMKAVQSMRQNYGTNVAAKDH